mmetsp:Transcript_59504/g.111427  ORF Transcript_59504/g.111427 Transcript_59504/m.111427 type:complete len:150 (+) Transcript_59504:55-504(+)
MARRLASEALEAQEANLETPPKQPRLEPREATAALLVVHKELPDFGGRLAEFLWGARSVSKCSLHHLLCTSQAAQLKLIVGIKEARLTSRRSTHEDVSFSHMCDELQATYPQSWASSRRLQLSSTECADEKFVKSILRVHCDSQLTGNP